ncbi:hypothetical protein GOFOIKOB_6259 [Methylobacterium tardum]|uniref:Uncharacterized protein n=1 Tax=Methylobacterium tardum TaxID=374432 RepID=A0AA37WNV0_9HYPH|nr:hypothetical protein [Methylobacterium tardum]GJE53183.1 hypothetical protein GOFOIKOB_6259 [Methylobacterium tardum]GLS68275.1 hypothetical protein GCM10007890_02870 [Methylobacterium tardum]
MTKRVLKSLPPPTKTEKRLRRWSGYGVVERHKELEHLRRSVPTCPAIPALDVRSRHVV